MTINPSHLFGPVAFTAAMPLDITMHHAAGVKMGQRTTSLGGSSSLLMESPATADPEVMLGFEHGGDHRILPDVTAIPGIACAKMACQPHLAGRGSSGDLNVTRLIAVAPCHSWGGCSRFAS